MDRRHGVILFVAFLLEAAHGQQPIKPPGDAFRELAEKEAYRYEGKSRALPLSSADSTIDITYYKLNLQVTVSPGFLHGVVTVHARSTVTQLTAISLDLSSTMTVDSVMSEGAALRFIQHPTTVFIELNRSYGYGEMVVLDVYYRGIPASTGFGSFEFGSHPGGPWVWTLSEPYGARDWWPCKDHPLDKADSVDIWVRCRSDLKVASNGKLLRIVDHPDSTHTYQWAERYPIATYLVFISLTNYAEFTDWFHYTVSDSMPILHYVLPEHLPSARDSFRVVPEMLRIFSETFGLYPFINEKYGHAEFGRGGAMEHQTMTSLIRAAFTELVLAHELAHQWFGDFITCASWRHLWLNEGFASYAEALYNERRYGPEHYRQSIREAMALAKTGRGPVIKNDTSDIRSLFDQRTVYRKGSSILHMLRHVLGDSLFFLSLRAYTSDPRLRYGVATTEDFQDVCERVAGRSLDWFFQEWLYGENYPRYAYTWSATPDTNAHWLVTITINQTTETLHPSFFVMPIDVRLSNTSRDTTVTLFNHQNPQTFSVRLAFRPERVELDPEEWILRDILPSIGGDGVPTSFRLLQNYPNPFNEKTTIAYEIPNRTHVSLAIYDLLGRTVAMLVNSIEEPGYKSVQFNAADNASGVYVCRLQAAGFTATRKLLLIK